MFVFFFFQAEDGIRDWSVTGVQTCALPIFCRRTSSSPAPPQRSSPRARAGDDDVRRQTVLADHLRRVRRPDATQAHARALEPLRGRVLPEPFAIIATARTGMADDEFRVRTRAAIGEFARIQPPSEAVWERFAGALSYVAGDPADASLYPRLERALKDAEATRSGPANRLFYCATPPSLYDDITANLGASGLARPAAGGFTRIIIEKPFGRDYASAQALGRRLAAAFRAEQVYRIDHFRVKD